MTAPSNEAQWSQEDALTLIESMKTTLPSQDNVSYKVTLSRIDWNKLAFKEYTGTMCCQKWNEISNRVRKFRTLTELITDSEEYVKNPYKGRKISSYPDFPKKPLTAYFRFFIENIKKYEAIHPGMTHAELSKMLSLIYKELPEEKKKKYIEDYEREKEEFDRNLEKFREQHPDLVIEGSLKSKKPKPEGTNVPEKRKSPEQMGEQGSSEESETATIAKRKKRNRHRRRKNVSAISTQNTFS